MEKFINKVVNTIKEYEENPIIYGSVGLSQYLGSFKDFGDLDILVQDDLVDNSWNKFKTFLGNEGWSLVDEKEHEFNVSGKIVSFASRDILIRDGIMNDFSNLLQFKDTTASTLSVEDFIKVYKHSIKDGYRINQRKKKDDNIIKSLEEYLKKV